MALTCKVPESEIKDVADFLGNNVGKIVSFSNFKETSIEKESNKQIILQPQWLASVLACIITFQHQFIKNGILQKQEIIHILKGYNTDQHEYIIECLQKFNILIFIKQLGYYIAPSLLPETISDDDKINQFPFKEDFIEQGSNYQFYFLPIGFISQIIGRILLLEDIKVLLIWRFGIIFSSKENEFVFIELDEINFSLTIRIRFHSKLSSSNIIILGRVCYIIESTLAILYNARDSSKFIRTIPCSNCLTSKQLNGSNKDDNKEINSFQFVDCIISVMKGDENIYCEICDKHVNLHHCAPDVVFTFINIIEDKELNIIKKIGKGGFGSVYLAELKDSNNKVAVKELSLESFDNVDINIISSKYSEFFTEVAFMKGLDHECIVSLHGIRLKPSLGMVMEFLPLGDLFKFLRNISPVKFSWTTRIRITLDIAKAMEYMDRKQLVHRDLRTENILLYEDSSNNLRAKLADFGLSRQLITESHERGHEIWQYNPPERLRKNIYDIQSDVYSFGICCWEIASLKLPYEEWEHSDKYFNILANGRKEINLFDLKNDIVHGLRPSMSLIDINTPTKFEKLINSCLKKKRTERPTFAKIVNTLGKLGKISYLI